MQSLLSRTYLNAVLRLAAQHGVDITPLQSRLVRADFSDYVPFECLQEAVLSLVAAMPGQSVGFAVGQQLAVSSHGSVGVALSSCRDLAESLEIVSRYDETRAQFFNLEVAAPDRQHLSLIITQRHNWGDIAVPLYEALLVCIHEILHYMIGSATVECRVAIPYSKPALWASEYDGLMFKQIEFDARGFVFTLPSALLSMPSISFDAKALQRAKQQCEIELQQLRRFDTLARAITDYLLDHGDLAVNIDAVARVFNTSVSTLIRRLKSENTSFKTIVEQLRRQRAEELLADSGLSIESIALQLGYSDVSNFSRSFKRWFGCTPGAYRQANA